MAAAQRALGTQLEDPAELCAALRRQGREKLAVALVDECLPGVTDAAVALRLRLEQSLAAFSIGDGPTLARCLGEEPEVARVLRPLLEGNVAENEPSRWRRELGRVAEAVRLAASGQIEEARARLTKVGPAHREALHVGAFKAAVTLSGGGKGAPAALGRVLDVLPDSEKPGAVAELIREQPEAAQRFLHRNRAIPRHRDLAVLARAAFAMDRGKKADAGLMQLGAEPLDPSWVTTGAEGTVSLYEAFAHLAEPAQAKACIERAIEAGADLGEALRAYLVLARRHGDHEARAAHRALRLGRVWRDEPGGELAALAAYWLAALLAGNALDWETLENVQRQVVQLGERAASSSSTWTLPSWLGRRIEAELALKRDRDPPRAVALLKLLLDERPHDVRAWWLAVAAAPDPARERAIRAQAYRMTGVRDFRPPTERVAFTEDTIRERLREPGLSPGRLAQLLYQWCDTRVRQGGSGASVVLDVLREPDFMRALGLLGERDQTAVSVAALSMIPPGAPESGTLVRRWLNTPARAEALGEVAVYLGTAEAIAALAEACLADGDPRATPLVEALARGGAVARAGALLAKGAASLDRSTMKRIEAALAGGGRGREIRRRGVLAAHAERLHPEFDLLERRLPGEDTPADARLEAPDDIAREDPSIELTAELEDLTVEALLGDALERRSEIARLDAHVGHEDDVPQAFRRFPCLKSFVEEVLYGAFERFDHLAEAQLASLEALARRAMIRDDEETFQRFLGALDDAEVALPRTYRPRGKGKKRKFTPKPARTRSRDRRNKERNKQKQKRRQKKKQQRKR
ncbi:MAG: hypothetical protein AAF715_20300 [Myxococcota bacterium]